MGERLCVFISAVTGEFGEARDALAADLRAKGHSVTGPAITSASVLAVRFFAPES